MASSSEHEHEHEAATGLSLSMRMAVYGITKKFPSVRNVSCSQFNQWMRDDSKKVVCLVSLMVRTCTCSYYIGYRVCSYYVAISTDGLWQSNDSVMTGYQA